MATIRREIAVLSAVTAFFALTSVCFAADLSVPVPYSTIQAAINDANDGDVVIVADGTYTGDGNRDIDFLGRAITVRSTDPNDPNVVAATVIDCQGTETEPHRGFRFHSAEDANSVVAGLTVTGGYRNDDGGAIYCDASSPSFRNCAISGNTAANQSYGGGMYCFASSPTLTNCIFTGNSAYRGGGVYNYESNGLMVIGCIFINNCGERAGGGMLNILASPTLINCTFSGNIADADNGNGGGVWNVDSNPTMTNCTFSGNSAAFGGGMSNRHGSPTIANCTFIGNRADYSGGGMENHGSSPTLTNCTFNGNRANNVGGGMLSWWGSSVTLTGCIFSGNWARWYGGGGVSNGDSQLTVINCTFSGNAADGPSGGPIPMGGGGAIDCWGFGQATLTNCVLWGNDANDGPEIALVFTPPDEVGPTVTVSYSDVQGGLNSVYVHSYATLNWGIGNIDADPCFVDLGYRDPNGTPDDPNDDFWIDGDYHLKSEGWRWDSVRERWDYDEVTSRCIDAGNPGCLLVDEPLSVPPDPENIWGENIRINMGAYGGTAEASMPPYHWALLADLNNDGTVDFTDFTYLAAIFTDQDNELPADFDRDGNVDLADVALLVEDWVKETSWHGQ